MFFYLAFPFLIVLIPKIINYKWIFILTIIAVIPVLTIVVPENYYHEIFYVNPFARVVDFIIGIVIFNFYKAYSRNMLNANYDYLEISALLLLLLFFIFHPWVSQVARYSFYYWIPMGYLIFSFSYQKGKVSALLSRKLFIHLGEISFGFYMFHQLVLRYFSVINSKILHIDNVVSITLITFTISLGVSHYSFILFEKPMNSYLKKILKKRKSASTTL